MSDDINVKMKDLVDGLNAKVNEYIDVTNQEREMLTGIIVWLMNKHHYEQIKIPSAHLQDAIESKIIEISGDEQQSVVTMKPKVLTFDEITAQPTSPWFQMAADMAREHAKAIDPNVV